MSELRFEYNLFNVPGSNTYPLNEKAKAKFETEINIKYKDYIERINACNGYYNVRSVSHDGLVFSGNLAATVELLEEIHRKIR